MFRTVLYLLLIANFHNIEANYDVTASNGPRFAINSIIRQLFEIFRNLIRSGDLEKNIPVLDPYEFDHASFDISGKGVRATANFTNGIVTGLGEFQLDSFTFLKDELAMTLNFTFPLISFISEHYNMEGILLQIFPLLGKGLIQIELLNISIQGKIYLMQSNDGKSILLRHFENVQFTVENVQSGTQFNNNIDEVINAMVSDLLADYLSRFSKAICITYGDVVIEALNTILIKYENWHIIAVIL